MAIVRERTIHMELCKKHIVQIPHCYRILHCFGLEETLHFTMANHYVTIDTYAFVSLVQQRNKWREHHSMMPNKKMHGICFSTPGLYHHSLYLRTPWAPRNCSILIYPSDRSILDWHVWLSQQCIHGYCLDITTWISSLATFAFPYKNSWHSASEF